MGESCILEITTERDVDALMGWFPDAASVNIWGGPRFRYPFTRSSFIKDCRIKRIESYSLRRNDGAMVAFGQVYDRGGRAHLARLIVNPALRRLGYGAQLIEQIIDALREKGEYSGVSLFVYRHNETAYRCYRSLGFTVQDYPPRAALQGECYFMTRPIDFDADVAASAGPASKKRRRNDD